jgi:heterodisulfide reductase subunit D
MITKKQDNAEYGSNNDLKSARIYKKSNDLFSCSRCGTCLSVCPVYKNTLDEGVTPRGKLSLIEAAANGKIQLTDKISGKIYTCTLCNYCTKECPSGVKINELFKAVRQDLVDNMKYPEILNILRDKIKQAYNITFDSNQGRIDWLKQIPDVNVGDYVRDKAEVVYFTGCVSSFSPRSFSIPRAVVKILKHADIDFTLLGEDEWCCGFPLLSSGMVSEAKFLAEHNIQMIKNKGAKTLIASCPSCFHTFKHEYEELTGEKADFEIMHVSQYLLKLVREGKIKLNPLDLKVTYHDPCDLGRNSGIYMEPRELIKSIPGVKISELSFREQQSNCCGGGGNIESINPGLSAKIAENRADEIIATGAEIVVSACQQCERTLGNVLKKKKTAADTKVKVMDISELLLGSMSI